MVEYNGQSQVPIEYLYLMLNARCGRGARERNSTRPGSGRIKNQIRTNNTDPLLRKIAIRWQFIITVTALHTHTYLGHLPVARLRAAWFGLRTNYIALVVCNKLNDLCLHHVRLTNFIIFMFYYWSTSCLRGLFLRTFVIRC